MKITPTSTFALFLILLFAVLAFANFSPSAMPVQGAAGVALQTTPTPQADDASVIGSTDGILIMGLVIVLIVTLPLLFRKRRK